MAPSYSAEKPNQQQKCYNKIICVCVCVSIFFFQNLITGLELLGHKTQRYSDRGSVICAIAKNQTGIFANADYRKAGEVIGL